MTFKFDPPSWKMEFRQRNELSNQIKNLHDDDIIIISDMDEFVDPSVLFSLKYYSKDQKWLDARLHMFNHCFYMNCVLPKEPWRHPFVCKWKKFKTLPDISHHRHSGGMAMHFPDAGWHFSYLGGVNAVMEKISASCHTELDKEEINNFEYQLKCMNFGIPPSKDKKEFHLKNCEFYFVPIYVYPKALQKIMLDNPQYLKLCLV